MKAQKLPDIYKGYLTKELLDMWEQLKGPGITPGTPVEKIAAMSDLRHEFKISPEARA